MLLKKVTIFLCLLALFSSNTLLAQKYTISGYVKDAASGEDLISATVIVKELSTGAITNEYGFYSITIPAGDYTLIYKYLSYANTEKLISLQDDISITVELTEESVTMDDVVITGRKDNENVTSTEISTISLDIEKIKKMPALFGEVDIIKTIQLLPGVSGVGEGLSGYYVRGGNNDHNLILLDEATVYNASHVLGFFSVFNADALKSETKLYKGGVPAQYGGRLASVLDLRMKEGNSKQFHGSGGIGLISSRLSLEGPIVKNKSSFIVSARRTYADMFLLLSKDEDIRATKAYFYDFNAKANYIFSDKDRLFVSGYFGKDVFKFQDVFGNDWGNATGTIRWNHLFSDKLFSNTTFIYSDFKYGFEFAFGETDRFEFNSGIRDITLKQDYNWFLNPKNQIRFGWQSTLHKFNPGQFIPLDDSTYYNSVIIDPDYAIETGFYISNKQKLHSRLTIEYGLRYSLFDQIGPGEEYEFDDEMENATDTTNYGTAELIQHYGGFEPRLSGVFLLNEKSSIKASYNRNIQYLQMASNATASFPWDIWFPSGKHVQPQIADQIAVGFFQNLFDNEVEASVEVYYKWMQNQVDFKNGAELILNPTLETELLFGKAWSYGAEFLLMKKFGRLTGWIGYTLSKTEKRIEGINNGELYPVKNDRRHDVSIVVSYEIKPRITISGTWVYATGNATTFPRHKTELEGLTVPVYSDRNQDRMPDFSRLDLAFDIKFKKKKETQRWSHGLNISLYNAYGRRNAFAIQFIEAGDLGDKAKIPDHLKEVTSNPNNTVAVKTFLFTWVPSLTWNFNF